MLPDVGKNILEERLLQQKHRGGGLYRLCGKERGGFVGGGCGVALTILIL